MRVTYPSSIARRSRPQPEVLAESGFVLILVLPVAIMLIMTALSIVTRSNSAAITSTNESRAQTARMAAEYGFNQMMARINTQYDSSNNPPLVIGDEIAIANSTGASYTILPFSLPVPPVGSCSDANDNNADLFVSIQGRLNIGSTNYRQTIIRTLTVCSPAPNKLSVRGSR